MRFALLAAIVAVTGCHSVMQEENVAPNQVLAGPYALRLAVAPKTVRPGEKVVVSVEFENTGVSDLWIPRSREIFLEYRSGSGGGGSFSSSCDGIRYVRLHRGEKIKHELPFDVPIDFGVIAISISIRPDVSVPLTVERWYPQASETSSPSTPPPQTVVTPSARST